MKFTLPFAILTLASIHLTSCNEASTTEVKKGPPHSEESFISSVVRINSTTQGWNPFQPWDKAVANNRSALGALLKDNRILTTAEMATNITYIELENADSTRSIPAKVIAIDYEANLALLEAANENTEGFFNGLKPLGLGSPIKIGEKINLVQLEDNGMSIITPSTVQTVDILSSFNSGHYFLTYQAKGSLQSATSSYTLPAVTDGKLVGLLTGYNNKDQLIDIIAPEIISAFLDDAADNEYQGFPSLGVSVSYTVDPSFRQWLKLNEDTGGIYITNVQKGSAAEEAGLQKGDVITQIDEHPIGRRGYYTDETYGKLYWSHLIRGIKKVNDHVQVTVIREAVEQQLTAKLKRSAEKLVQAHSYDQAPRYLVKGGFIFQELSYDYLRGFGEDWENKAPLDFLDIIASPEEYEKDRNRVVILTATIPTPATTGYESLRNQIINKVNGQIIADIPSLIKAFKTADSDGLHTIQLKDGRPETVYLDAQASDAMDIELLKRGIPALSKE